MSKYAIGIDFGTLSARALVVDVSDGTELYSAVSEYEHAVIDEYLPTGRKLPPDWALQHPRDYLISMKEAIKGAIEGSGVDPKDIIAAGVDFTSSTLIPVLRDGTPLCFLPEYENEPLAYATLWKHHGAQKYASLMTEHAMARGDEFLLRYGGKISSEWSMPKIWQVLEEAPEIYAKCNRFAEAGDWIVLQLTGSITHNACMAGYKYFWSKRDGYPENEFYTQLDERLDLVMERKVGGHISPLGSLAGYVTEYAAKEYGLPEGIAVCVSNIDAHASVPAAGVLEDGLMVMIMGTSTGHLLLSKKDAFIPGVCGCVDGGIIPGFNSYEAGQSCVGDHFDWFVHNCVPESYEIEAREKGVNLHELLTQKAEKQRPGESGLLALDWWNGNRSVLVDADLTGLMLGMTLQTKPEDMYRALIEATAYGTRKIIENYEEHGAKVNTIIASGGVAKKNPMLMQIYADVCQREIKIVKTNQAPALGSAIYACVAAGKERGGYDDIYEAVLKMGGVNSTVYRPDPENSRIYDELYKQYVILHDLFGRGANDVMKVLKGIKAR